MAAPQEERFVCIHGHFYQPPRENPWLEAVEIQDSAAPYHDWNERITAECYLPNTVARLLDSAGRIVALRNNYQRISFNFGPTLLSWLEMARPDVYAAVVQADRDSVARLGNGNALAQVYGHCIMPLASPRDQQTQVRWGIADFTHRFGRNPTSMWLPETAVDRATLRVLARHGMRFTVLAPGQAARVRYAQGPWHTVTPDSIDTTRPYRCSLGDGLSIILFFYDAPIAHEVAFGGLLNDGRELARRLAGASVHRTGNPLVHIATDGESYGHHHRFGEMALAAAIAELDHDPNVKLTNYAAYLDRVVVEDEVEIVDNSSWSCAHGVERWRANCGCHVGHPDWQQSWRTPLRSALDWLKRQLDKLFEQQAQKVLVDPWAARDDYIAVTLKRSREHQDAFLERHTRHTETPLDRTRVWQLLEMQRHALLSFTSCGWFFDEPSGLETTQILTYAARAIQLARDFGAHLEERFLLHLEPMRSNLPRHGNGRQLYRELVQPLVSDGPRLVAHYAMNGLLEAPQPETHLYAHKIASLERSAESAGTATFAIGRARITALTTEEQSDYEYAALHLGGHDMQCTVAAKSNGDFAALRTGLLQAFRSAPLAELLRRLDASFGPAQYTLQDVFVAERRRILDSVTAQAQAECNAAYERLVLNNQRLLDFLAQGGGPIPAALRVAASFVIQRRFEKAVRACTSAPANVEEAQQVLAAAKRWGIPPEMQPAQLLMQEALEAAVGELTGNDSSAALQQAHALLDAAQHLSLPLDTYETQNRYYALVVQPGTRVWPKRVVPALCELGRRLQFDLAEWRSLDASAA